MTSAQASAVAAQAMSPSHTVQHFRAGPSCSPETHRGDRLKLRGSRFGTPKAAEQATKSPRIQLPIDRLHSTGTSDPTLGERHQADIDRFHVCNHRAKLQSRDHFPTLVIPSRNVWFSPLALSLPAKPCADCSPKHARSGTLLVARPSSTSKLGLRFWATLRERKANSEKEKALFTLDMPRSTLRRMTIEGPRIPIPIRFRTRPIHHVLIS
jgi:hypothetical protein